VTQIEHQRFVLFTCEQGVELWLTNETTLATFLLMISEAFTNGFFIDNYR
jgi:hypothetical protein